ncbi:MAG: hypothetical protein B6D64_11135 [Bacteroidetes bacterium 4484_276]|nr:MAG: hypothetical protein B6D64_11135 [Bacteroidetes bacterium 4484_276]
MNFVKKGKAKTEEVISNYKGSLTESEVLITKNAFSDNKAVSQVARHPKVVVVVCRPHLCFGHYRQTGGFILMHNNAISKKNK